MKKKKLIFFLIILFLVIIFSDEYVIHKFFYESETIKIANWNLDVFGEKKSNNLQLMSFYVDKIKNYDIIFVQEIRDKSETAFPKLCSMLQNYSCKMSSRAGRSSSKEQYGVIYKDTIDLIYFKDYNPDSEDRWERPPIEVAFNAKSYGLTIYNIHTKPDDVQKELQNLEKIISDYGNVLVLGDLNADCSYYSKKTEFENWNWVVKNTEDTTVAKSSCAYDRIILNSDAKNEYENSGVDKQGITSEISEHYLVWIELKV